MMFFLHWTRGQWRPLSLLIGCLIIVFMIQLRDQKTELYRGSSNRYRFHAIPVALSHLYYGWDYDYSASRDIAWNFQGDAELQVLIDKFSTGKVPISDHTYFWIADDRGAADYVTLAFYLFGPKEISLAKFYYLLLLTSVGFYFMAFWRDPLALYLAFLTLLGIFLLTYGFVVQSRSPHNIPLFESRVFESLGFIAFLHAALVVWRGCRLGYLEFVFLLPQVAFLVFLLHARSALGWQFLALSCLAGCRLLAVIAHAIRNREIRWATLIRGGVVLGSVSSGLYLLSAHKQATYHPSYFTEGSARTFWHNALMGFEYHPQLRAKIHAKVDHLGDKEVVEAITLWMRERNDPRLSPEWNANHILCSLGGHTKFDWDLYEQVAKEFYFDTWQTYPREMAANYFFYKPKVIFDHIRSCIRANRHARSFYSGQSMRFLFAVALALVMGFVATFDTERVTSLRSCASLAAFLTPFSLIPGCAFYVAFTTISGFCLCLTIFAGLGACGVMHALFHRRWRGAEVEPQLAAPLVRAESPQIAA